MPRKKPVAGGRRTLARTGVNAIVYDIFQSTFPSTKYVLRNEEEWEITEYYAQPKFVREWSNPSYQTTPNFILEEWNLTQYAAILKPIAPGYSDISEPWNVTTYGTVLRTDEQWEFTTEYISDSMTETFFEEWEFTTEYITDSMTETFFEEWES